MIERRALGVTGRLVALVTIPVTVMCLLDAGGDLGRRPAGRVAG